MAVSKSMTKQDLLSLHTSEAVLGQKGVKFQGTSYPKPPKYNLSLQASNSQTSAIRAGPCSIRPTGNPLSSPLFFISSGTVGWSYPAIYSLGSELPCASSVYIAAKGSFCHARPRISLCSNSRKAKYIPISRYHSLQHSFSVPISPLSPYCVIPISRISSECTPLAAR